MTELLMEANLKKNERYFVHQRLCNQIHDLYLRKNSDYGNSFGDSLAEEGLAAARIRIGDKFNRFKQLSRNPKGQKVNDESLKDTLLDMANYCLMTVVEMEMATGGELTCGCGEENDLCGSANINGASAQREETNPLAGITIGK